MATNEPRPVVSAEDARCIVAVRRVLSKIETAALERGFAAGDGERFGYGRLHANASTAEDALRDVLVTAAIWCEETPSREALNRPL